jgi:hypothetical protein
MKKSKTTLKAVTNDSFFYGRLIRNSLQDGRYESIFLSLDR